MKYLLSLTLLLTGCASLSPAPQVVEVKIPISVSCVKEIPAKPIIHTNEQLKLFDDYGFITAIHADRLALDLHSDKLSALLEACR